MCRRLLLIFLHVIPYCAAWDPARLSLVVDHLHRMTEQCFRKCVAMYKEPELSVGEATCVDRCVHKYMTSHTKVQEILQKHAAAAQAQQQGMR